MKKKKSKIRVKNNFFLPIEYLDQYSIFVNLTKVENNNKPYKNYNNKTSIIPPRTELNISISFLNDNFFNKFNDKKIENQIILRFRVCSVFNVIFNKSIFNTRVVEIKENNFIGKKLVKK